MRAACASGDSQDALTRRVPAGRGWARDPAALRHQPIASCRPTLRSSAARCRRARRAPPSLLILDARRTSACSSTSRRGVRPRCRTSSSHCTGLAWPRSRLQRAQAATSFSSQFGPPLTRAMTCSRVGRTSRSNPREHHTHPSPSRSTITPRRALDTSPVPPGGRPSRVGSRALLWSAVTTMMPPGTAAVWPRVAGRAAADVRATLVRPPNRRSGHCPKGQCPLWPSLTLAWLSRGRASLRLHGSSAFVRRGRCLDPGDGATPSMERAPAVRLLDT